MKALHELLNCKKGISSLFITIYVLLLAAILISTLLVALGISNSSLTTNYEIERKREQEHISIAGPGGLELDGTTVSALRVNNLGSITVRIRSIYIGQSFKCDPSTFTGDSYIEPKESLWVQFSGNLEVNYEETKNLYWTVTTERATSSTVKGKYILNDPGTVPDTDYLRFGPFELAFEDFHWKSDAVNWQPGWSIPKSTKNVQWQINLTNIDDEPIVLTTTSCFLVVGNNEIPESKLTWYIQPGNLVLAPGDDMDVYFDRKSDGSTSNTPNFGKFQSGTSCLNLLVLTGYYANRFGVPYWDRPIAQTIPFEAILVTD